MPPLHRRIVNFLSSNNIKNSINAIMPAGRPTREKPSESRHHPYRDTRATKHRALADECRDLLTIPLSHHIDIASGYLLDLLKPICATNRVPAEIALDEAEKRKDLAKQKLNERHK